MNLRTILATLFIIAAILCGDTITGAEIGAPRFNLGKTTGNMRDLTITVPVTKVSGRESITVNVRVVGTDGKDLATAMLTDVLTADGQVCKTVQISGRDASAVAKVVIDR